MFERIRKFLSFREKRAGSSISQIVGLDVEDLANYRPVANLSYLSKIEERAMLEQLIPFLEEAGVIPHCQSAYRRFHSTDSVMQNI